MLKDLAAANHYLNFEFSPEAILMHRDVKLSNIGVASSGALKLFDFGNSRCTRRTGRNIYGTYDLTGGIGSIRYMAPEVVLHLPYNEKADVYSFAIIAWYNLSLTRSFFCIGIQMSNSSYDTQ